jgi:hypothetical protein
MTTEIRDDEQIAIDTPAKTGLRRHLSFRRGHYNVTKSNVDSTDNLDNSPTSALIPLLPKDARKVAVKMIKGWVSFDFHFCTAPRKLTQSQKATKNETQKTLFILH